MPSYDTVNNRGGAAYKFYAIRSTDGYKTRHFSVRHSGGWFTRSLHTRELKNYQLLRIKIQLSRWKYVCYYRIRHSHRLRVHRSLNKKCACVNVCVCPQYVEPPIRGFAKLKWPCGSVIPADPDKSIGPRVLYRISQEIINEDIRCTCQIIMFLRIGNNNFFKNKISTLISNL